MALGTSTIGSLVAGLKTTKSLRFGLTVHSSKPKFYLFGG